MRALKDDAMLLLSVIIAFLLLGVLWLAAVVHEHGLSPMRDFAALMRRPAVELAFVALIVGASTTARRKAPTA